jgi:hypothetical protein
VIARIRQADRQPGSAAINGMVDRSGLVGDERAVLFVVLKGLDVGRIVSRPYELGVLRL